VQIALVAFDMGRDHAIEPHSLRRICNLFWEYLAATKEAMGPDVFCCCQLHHVLTAFADNLAIWVPGTAVRARGPLGIPVLVEHRPGRVRDSLPRCGVEGEDLADPWPRQVVALQERRPPSLLVAREGDVVALARHAGDDRADAVPGA